MIALSVFPFKNTRLSHYAPGMIPGLIKMVLIFFMFLDIENVEYIIVKKEKIFLSSLKYMNSCMYQNIQ